jgi:oxepin-CoA hydrolase/3-oxo-5,6-dehydrosuberyl-CoA semialdehyde dehydrogenase
MVAAASLLGSYVAGRRFAASDDGAPIADAVTRETVVRVSSTGLDGPAMLRHARVVGGPPPRELTFHQRAVADEDRGQPSICASVREPLRCAPP